MLIELFESLWICGLNLFFLFRDLVIARISQKGGGTFLEV